MIDRFALSFLCIELDRNVRTEVTLLYILLLPITSEIDTTSKYISSPVSITFTTQDSPTWAYSAFSACPKVRATEFTLSK